jgi:hypothetical protein
VSLHLTQGGAVCLAPEVRHEVHHVYVRVEVDGQQQLKTLLALVDALRPAFQSAWRSKSLMLVFSELDNSPDRTAQALMGEHIGVSLGRVLRIASVAPRMMEDSVRVARRYGANVRLFPCEAEARGWLLGAVDAQ